MQPKFTKTGLQVEVEYPPDMEDVPRSGDRRQYLSASKVKETPYLPCYAAMRRLKVLAKAESGRKPANGSSFYVYSARELPLQSKETRAHGADCEVLPCSS